MNECSFCGKSCNKGAFIPEGSVTCDRPFCDNICLKKYRIERGYDKPKLNWEKYFKITLLKEEKIELLEKLKKIRNDIKILAGDKLTK